MNIVIIEDEPLLAEDLSESLRELDADLHILAVLPSVRRAVDFFKRNNTTIHLIFSDIQLQDGLSFEIFKSLSLSAPVVFCTAYDQYALAAFQANGIDYLLKPFGKTALEAALQKYKDLKRSLSVGISGYEKLLEMLERQSQAPTKRTLLVHHKDQIIPLESERIALFFIDNEVVRALTFEGKRYVLDRSMDELERHMGGAFFRVNRQFLVQRPAIAGARRYFARKLLIELNLPFDTEIVLSKERVPLFLEWLGG